MPCFQNFDGGGGARRISESIGGDRGVRSGILVARGEFRGVLGEFSVFSVNQLWKISSLSWTLSKSCRGSVLLLLEVEVSRR